MPNRKFFFVFFLLNLVDSPHWTFVDEGWEGDQFATLVKDSVFFP